MTITRHVEVHSASVQDRDGAAFVLDRITRRFPFLEGIVADAGYQGTARRRGGSASSRDHQAQRRRLRRSSKRWVIERTFAWACINR